MRTIKITAAALASVSLLAIPTLANASDTTTSFTVAADSAGLTISQSDSSATLSEATFSLTGASVTGTLPETTVTDERGTLLAGWIVTVSGTHFAHDTDASQTVAKSNARVYLDAANLTELTTDLLSGALNGMTITGFESNADSSNLGTNYTLIAGTTDLGSGSVTYTPTMDVTVPAETPAGTYTATVTQTVS